LGKTEPTDVLAFPIDSFDVSTTDTPLLLGDVVICPEMAMENAKAQNKTLEEEIALLVLHGVLHILGYDHAEPNEKAVMKKREKQLLSELYLS
jgi:probable rRNA maturation factor